MRSWLQRSLWDVVPRDQRDTSRALRRRQLVTWSVVLVGAVVLGISMRIDPGSPWFYPATLALAAIWTAGALASGPLHLGRIARRDELRRPALAPITLGLALAALCLGAGLVLRRIDFVDEQVDSVLDLADQRVLWLVALVTLVNGVAEELFFRGAMYAATPRHPVALTTVAYTAATAVTGNVMLTVAAFALGLVVGLERRASGGILAPALTHVTWSLSLLFLLPVVFG